MEPRCGRCHVFQIAEHSAVFQDVPDFSIQSALSQMIEVVDRKTGNDCVEAAVVRQRLVKIVLDNVNTRVSSKPFLQSV